MLPMTTEIVIIVLLLCCLYAVGVYERGYAFGCVPAVPLRSLEEGDLVR